MITITMITTKGCHNCEDAKNILNKLKSTYALSINEIDSASDKGQELVKKYNITATPGIIINNEFFSSGKVTEDQLKKKFDTLKK